jgi:hypothetical protein
VTRALYSQPERGGAAPEDARTGLAAGFLAMVPLLAVYEWGLAATGGARRNVGERLLTLALQPLGEHLAWVRPLLWCAAAAGSWLVLRAAGVRARAALARIVLEGLAAAVVLGPLLVLGMSLLDAWVPRPSGAPATNAPPPLETAALIAGGAAWEELCFRVGGWGLCFVLAAVVARALGAGEAVSRRAADAVGWVGSSALFALAHLERFNAPLGAGGAAFEAGHFTWLFLAGMLLGLVFRLRGPGVAAWCHGLFNLGLVLGVDPDVLA